MEDVPKGQGSGIDFAIALALVGFGVGAVIAQVQLAAPQFLWFIAVAFFMSSFVFFARAFLKRYRARRCAIAPVLTSEGLAWEQVGERKFEAAKPTPVTENRVIPVVVALGYQVMVRIWPVKDLPQPVVIHLYFTAGIHRAHVNLYANKRDMNVPATRLKAECDGSPEVVIELGPGNRFRELSMLSVIATSKVSGCKFVDAKRQVPI